MGILLIIGGVLGIIGAIFGKEFHAADVIALGEFKRKIPRRTGRLLFLVVGLLLIAVGIKLLVDAG